MKKLQEEKVMNKSIKRAAVLTLTALTLFTSTPYTNVAKAASVAPVHTAVTSTGKADGQKITYKLTLDKATVTDGRVAVEYDPNVLVLKSDSEGIKFSDVDVNKNYVNEEAKGIAYAFVNDAPKTAAGTLMTVQFTVKAGLASQDTTIKTKILGINNEATDVVATTDMEDVVSVGRPTLSTPKINSVSQTILGVYVKWSKDANADGYVVYRSTSKDGKYSKLATVSGLTSFYDIAVANNKTYYYKVVSYQGSGKTRVYSEESAPVSIKVKKFFGLFS